MADDQTIAEKRSWVARMAARDDWLALVEEPILDPSREIVDPHHHLWDRPGRAPYLLDDLWGDTSSGHNIIRTIYMECGSAYRQDVSRPRLA